MWKSNFPFNAKHNTVWHLCLYFGNKHTIFKFYTWTVLISLIEFSFIIQSQYEFVVSYLVCVAFLYLDLLISVMVENRQLVPSIFILFFLAYLHILTKHYLVYGFFFSFGYYQKGNYIIFHLVYVSCRYNNFLGSYWKKGILPFQSLYIPCAFNSHFHDLP